MREDDIRGSFLQVAGLVIIAVATGTLGYHWVEGWTLFDALYMTVITLGTVGYGETHALSHNGRVFTIFLILFGISTLTYALTTLTSFIVEGSLRDVLRRRKMKSKIAELDGHYILCGAGHTGRTIVTELQKTHRKFVVVDTDAARLEPLKDQGVLVVEGDGTDDDVLREAGIERAKGLFAALPTDQQNVFVTIGARGLNPKLRLVCKQEEKGTGEKLKRSGADVVVNPGFIGGLRMASEMIRPAAVGLMDYMIRAEGVVLRIEEILVPEDSDLVGKPIGEVKGADGGAALVLAIKHPSAKTYDVNPDPRRNLEAGEVLVVLGDREQIKHLEGRVRG